MGSCWFYVVGLVVVIAVLAYAAWFIWGYWNNWRWVGYEGCSAYNDVAKTIIASSGFAAAILTAFMDSPHAPNWIARRSIGLLVLSIVASVFFMLVFTRATETAISRQREKPGSESAEYGKLNHVEFAIVMALAIFSILCFIFGFLYLARIAF